jgi:hypothetical protein
MDSEWKKEKREEGNEHFANRTAHATQCRVRTGKEYGNCHPARAMTMRHRVAMDTAGQVMTLSL